MVEVERGVHLLAQPRRRIVGDPHILLFQHDVELGPHHLVGEHQSGHSVGLELHHGLELVARHALEIAGVVGGGEGVLLAADGGDDLGKAPSRVLGGALEHQMFEEMGKPRLARRLVGGADLVPQHVGDHRRAVIGNDDDLETVREREVGDLGADPGVGGRDERRGKGGGGERQSLGHEFALVGLGVAPTMHVPAAERERKPQPPQPKCGWGALSRRFPLTAGPRASRLP